MRVLEQLSKQALELGLLFDDDDIDTMRAKYNEVCTARELEFFNLHPLRECDYGRLVTAWKWVAKPTAPELQKHLIIACNRLRGYVRM